MSNFIEELFELGLDLAEIAVDKRHQDAQVPHSFTVERTAAPGQRKCWYCARCGMRNEGFTCVECGERKP
jgi:hypothetical protein